MGNTRISLESDAKTKLKNPVRTESRNLSGNENELWFTKKEVAELFKVNERTLSNWMKEGKIEYFKPDGTVRISQRMIDTFTLKYTKKTI